MSAAIVRAKEARFPAVYEQAKAALEKCIEIDECKEWKDKAAALASYAKQADDETLFKDAMRIKGRAVRRMAELAKEVEPKPGRPKTSDDERTGFPTGAKSALLQAGLSPAQATQVLRVGAIPKAQFEKAIDAEKPPTLTALAKQGTKPSTSHLRGRDPKDFSASIDARGELRRMAEMCERVSPAIAVRGAADYDLPNMIKWVKTITAWTSRLEKELSK